MGMDAAMASRANILLVDDDALVLKATRLMLTEAEPGWRVEICDSPAQALEKCADSDFDAVIIDYNMPEMNGLSLARTMWGKRPDLPIIFLTGRGSEEVARDAFYLGAADYVIKGEPRAYERLVRAIHRAVDMFWTEDRLAKLVNQDFPFGLLVIDLADGSLKLANDLGRRLVVDQGRDKWLDDPAATPPGFVLQSMAAAKDPDRKEAPISRTVDEQGQVYQIHWRAVSLNGSAAGPSHLLTTITREEAKPHPSPELSKREQEVLGLVLSGMSNADIGKALFISEVTVKAHVSHVLKKYNVDSRAQLAAVLLGSPRISVDS